MAKDKKDKRKENDKAKTKTEKQSTDDHKSLDEEGMVVDTAQGVSLYLFIVLFNDSEQNKTVNVIDEQLKLAVQEKLNAIEQNREHEKIKALRKQGSLLEKLKAIFRQDDDSLKWCALAVLLEELENGVVKGKEAVDCVTFVMSEVCLVRMRVSFLTRS
jgi:hypothetical protein